MIVIGLGLGLGGCGGDHHVIVADASCAPPVIFLDRAGGTYGPGATDDATQNRSVMLDAPRTLPPFPGDDVAWGDLTACIREAMQPFQVTVTEVDPGSTPHLELVFTDRYWEDPAVTHVVPSSCRDNHQIEFIFGSALSTPTRGCEVAMAGLGEMIAQLGPSENCLDFTSPAGDCGIRSFLPEDVACVDVQTNLPAPCRCDAGQSTQNSFVALSTAFRCAP